MRWIVAFLATLLGLILEDDRLPFRLNSRPSQQRRKSQCAVQKYIYDYEYIYIYPHDTPRGVLLHRNFGASFRIPALLKAGQAFAGKVPF